MLAYGRTGIPTASPSPKVRFSPFMRPETKSLFSLRRRPRRALFLAVGPFICTKPTTNSKGEFVVATNTQRGRCGILTSSTSGS
jgi:hypothetical protein